MSKKAKQKLRNVCAWCGSEDITSDACARWNVDKQQWELIDTYDNTDCQRCGGECRVETVPINYDPWEFARRVDRVVVREGSDNRTFEIYHYKPGTKMGGAELLETFGVQRFANQAAKDFAASLDDCLVQLCGEDYP